MSVYSAHLRNIIINAVNDGEKPLSGLKISVDSGNGAGGFYSKMYLNRWEQMFRQVSFQSRTECSQITFQILKIPKQWKALRNGT